MAKLTVKSIDNLRPGPSRREIPDGLISGLYLVLQPSGARSWAVRYRVGTRSRKVTLGTYPAIALTDARDLAREVLVKVARGLDPASERKAAEADSFEAVAELYLSRYVEAECRPRTIYETRRILTRAAKAWRGRAISSATRKDIVAHLDAVADNSGPVASNRTRTVLSGLFRWAVERAIIDTSPVAGLPRPVKEEPRQRVLSDDELRAIWLAAGQIGFPGGSFVQMLILTAARRSEVAALPWSELDLDAGIWHLPKERSKNGRAHDIPLAAPAIAILRELPRIGDRFVFTTTGIVPLASFSEIKKALHAIAPLAPWRLHDLRRSAATVMAGRLGIAPHVVSAVLGHVNGDRVARTYNRATYTEEQAAALARWADHVIGLVEDRPSNIVSLARAES